MISLISIKNWWRGTVSSKTMILSSVRKELHVQPPPPQISGRAQKTVTVVNNVLILRGSQILRGRTCYRGVHITRGYLQVAYKENIVLVCSLNPICLNKFLTIPVSSVPLWCPSLSKNWFVGFWAQVQPWILLINWEENRKMKWRSTDI
jgi:hypothetical protein